MTLHYYFFRVVHLGRTCHLHYASNDAVHSKEVPFGVLNTSRKFYGIHTPLSSSSFSTAHSDGTLIISLMRSRLENGRSYHKSYCDDTPPKANLVLPNAW